MSPDKSNHLELPKVHSDNHLDTCLFAMILRQVAPGWRNTICQGQRLSVDLIGPSFQLLLFPVNDMRFKAWSLIAASAMLSAPLAASNAQYVFGTHQDVCGGTNFTFCLAISGQQGAGANAANFFVTIINEGLDGSNAAPYASIVFTALGFNGFANAPSFTSSPGTSFHSSNNINDLSNFSGTWVGAEANSPSPKDGLLFGESITFMFANTTAATFASSEFAIHAQAGPGGCSSKIELNLSQAAPPNGPNFIGEGCGGAPVTATPEPASLTLMATGFLGLGGVAIRRRRKA